MPKRSGIARYLGGAISSRVASLRARYGDLVASVEAVLRHKPFLSPKLSESGGSRSDGPDTFIGELTARELETAQLFAEGLGNKGIAARLDISVNRRNSPHQHHAEDWRPLSG